MGMTNLSTALLPLLLTLLPLIFLSPKALSLPVTHVRSRALGLSCWLVIRAGVFASFFDVPQALGTLPVVLVGGMSEI